MAYQVREAGPQDHTALQHFINAQNYLHRHLDWRDTLEWLGRQPFLLMEENRRLLSALACPPEPEEVAWLRLFGATMNVSVDRAWQTLFEPAYRQVVAMTPRPRIVSLAMRDWFEELLKRHGFEFHQDIVVFLYDDAPPPPLPLDDEITLRLMKPEDLPQVAVLDGLAFEPIWRLSRGDLEHAYARSSYTTVAELDGRIIAYQMSSTSGFYAHLARLAVDPTLQRRHIGYSVLQDLLEFFIERRSCMGVTLNTQHNNLASLALYRKTGFRETGERFPLFVYEE